ncbi:MAG: hypothetical protein R2822_13880 [Spirosomataceae bacterium]
MPVEQTLQVALSASVLEKQSAQKLLTSIALRYGDLPLMRDAIMSSITNQEFDFLVHFLQLSNWPIAQSEKEIWIETLTNAIVRKGNTNEMLGLLTRLDVDSRALDWQQKAILTALAIQAKNKKLKRISLEVTPKLFTRTDFDKPTATRLQTASALFEWPGHTAQTANAQQSLLNEEQQQQFALGRQHYLTTCAGCHGSDGEGSIVLPLLW